MIQFNSSFALLASCEPINKLKAPLLRHMITSLQSVYRRRHPEVAGVC